MTKAQGTSQLINYAPTRVVVLGDSHSASNTLLDRFWPSIYQEVMNNLGCNVKVNSLGRDAYTFYTANNTVVFGTNTMVQETIALNPDIVYVMLGVNDTISNVSRTLVQVKADALATFTALKAGLPYAKIIYLSELFFDSGNFPTANLIKNKGIVPFSFTLPAAGILSGTYCADMLNTVIAGGTQTLYSNWIALDAYIKTLTTLIDANITVNFWKIARLGCTSTEGLHPSALGSVMEAAYVIEGTNTINSSIGTPFPTLASQGNIAIVNADALFSAVLTASGDGYVTTIPMTAYPQTYAEWVNNGSGPFRKIDPDNWYLPYKTNYWRYPTTTSLDDTQFIINGVTNGPPDQAVWFSIDGGAWINSGITSDNKGTWQATTGPVVLAVGAHTLQVKVSNEVYGPAGGIPITITAVTTPYLKVRCTNTPTYTGAANPALISWDVTDEDNSSAYSAGSYTVPLAGVYEIASSIKFDAVAPNNAVNVYVKLNSNIIADGGINEVGGATPCGVSITMKVRCIVGDVLQILAACATTTTLTNTLNWATYIPNWATITRLHA